MMSQKGLTGEEAKKRLKKYGKNEIIRGKKISPLKIFISQFISPIILLLIIAAIISLYINFIKQETFFDSLLILGIIIAAGVAGFIQDYKAERAVEALQKMATPKAKVIRDGKEQEILSIEIVPGDLIILEGGDIIPADAKIIEGKLEIDESVLTGESRAEKKTVNDEIYSNCGIHIGRAIAKVFNTGMKTKIGKIASKMEEIKEGETPFQNHMNAFTRKIVGFTAFVIVITFIIGFKKFGMLEAGMIAVSLAVAAIPEDLPAVITIALSLGAKNMVKKNALVRRLAITESVGSADVICTDKTGTLTRGNMKVKQLWTLKNDAYSQKLGIKCCNYCNDAKQILKDSKKKWVGDETDIALKQFSIKSLKETGERIDEIPFSSEREMMTTIHKFNKKIIFSKGATEVILKKCTRCLNGKKIVKLDKKLKNQISEKNKELSLKGYRVLALAYKDYEKPFEKNLIFIGLAVLSDPPRPEVKQAIRECQEAGIRTIMITGDNPLTAKSIGDEVGINTERVITGMELDKMNENELKKNLKNNINIFARTTPFHKLRILKTLQNLGHIVVMTGDGVNDSLALKKADVGMAMGIKGTEVAKEASDIILLDDNFATIKNAVKEGRRIFDNIRKFVDYLLTCNVAEVIVVLLTTIFMPSIALFPVQILWINLITDGMPALALAIDPSRPDIMKRKPKKKSESIINKKLALLISGIGIEKAIILLATFFLVFPLGMDKARTALFTGFIIYEFVRIGVIRYNEKLNSIKDWIENKLLVYSLILSFTLQLIILYTPLGLYFNVVPLGIYEWLILLGGTVIGFILGIVVADFADKITNEDY